MRFADWLYFVAVHTDGLSPKPEWPRSGQRFHGESHQACHHYRGRNRSFDHLYATYVPHNQGESVNNLLSEGIVNADGTPGPNFAQAHQFQVTTPNAGQYFVSVSDADKALYTTLPLPILLELRRSLRFLSSCKFLAVIQARPPLINSSSVRAALA